MTVSDESELSDLVSPEMIREWLAAEKWALTNERPGVAQLWRSAGAEDVAAEVLLPIQRSFADYSRRLADVLDDLRGFYDISLAELVNRIAAVSTDVFFVRLDQFSQDGTIPFTQATDVLESIQKMVRAAATTTANPRHSHKGRRPPAVTEFLEKNLRFGHTRRGSFIITVAARLDSPPGATQIEADVPDENLPEAERGVVSADAESLPAAHAPDTDVDVVEPFERRVMQTLAKSLQATSALVADPGLDLIEDDLLADGISFELVQSVLEVASTEGLKGLDFSFEWAGSQPPAEPFEDEIHIPSAETPRLEQIRDSLTHEVLPDVTTIIGRVAELSREDLGKGQERSTVIIEADLFGKMRRVKVPLSTSEYEWAIFAHRNRLPFSVTGLPRKHRSWELEGIVTADTSFLKSRRDSLVSEGRLDSGIDPLRTSTDPE